MNIVAGRADGAYIFEMDSAGDLQASVLAATYEHADFLRRVLLGFSRQTVSNFEILVCDDGSGPDIRRLVEEQAKSFRGRLSHCRHEKAGFQKCRILNEGILKARGDYLIFIDADCIPHRHFVEEHLLARSEGTYLVGRRAQLGGKLTARLSDDWIMSGKLESPLRTLFPALLRGEIRHAEAGLYFPRWLRANGTADVPPLKGCNFSCWKSDMARINGFNEAFVTAGGGEDDDIERRFRLIGLRARSVKHSAICYHQYHSLVPREASGMELCESLEKEGRSVCERGLAQHGESK